MLARVNRLATLGVVAAVVLAGCTSTGDSDGSSDGSSDSGPEQAQVRQPAEPVTVLPDEDPAALALSASETFFESVPVVVLADEDDDPTIILRAASAGVALGAPVLLTGDDDAVPTELDRLGAGWALTFGGADLTGGEASTDDPDARSSAPADADGDVVSVPAPAGDEALADLLGVETEPRLSLGEDAEVEGVIGLPRGAFTPITVEEGTEADGTDSDAEATGDADETDDADADAADDADNETTGATTTDADDAEDDAAADAATAAEDESTTTAELPESELPEPLSGVLAMASGSSTGLAAVATAAAAGTELLLTPGGDPRATSETVTAVADSDSAPVVGIGADFEDAETLGWRVEAAATGVELPGGGQLVFPGKRYVALYGTPSTTALGVLGEQDVPGTIARAEEHAQAYEDLSEDTVVPALEIITTVASSSAGSDGNYSNEMPIEELRPLIDAAHEDGQYVVLDLQPGRSSFLEQAEMYSELLELPYVGLALDPEWNLGPDEVHMVQIGSTTAAEVNEVVDWLADFTRERALPQKMLILHQFQVRMIQTVPEVDLSRSELAVLVHADGQGSQPAKQGTWATLHANAPDIEWWGWKNFYDEDLPMLTPGQTAEVEPFPNFISYQ